jgi:hypothetical protein
MTFAPQSASWRTAVGPDRTLVRSITVKRDKAFDAGWNGIRFSLASQRACFNCKLSTIFANS